MRSFAHILPKIYLNIVTSRTCSSESSAKNYIAGKEDALFSLRIKDCSRSVRVFSVHRRGFGKREDSDTVFVHGITSSQFGCYHLAS